MNSHAPRSDPSLPVQPRQPVERRTLRRSETRARESELVRVCGEVVRATGVHGTNGNDPRWKSIDAEQSCASPAVRISTCTQRWWRLHISTRCTQRKTASGAGSAKRCRKPEREVCDDLYGGAPPSHGSRHTVMVRRTLFYSGLKISFLCRTQRPMKALNAPPPYESCPPPTPKLAPADVQRRVTVYLRRSGSESFSHGHVGLDRSVL